MELNDAIINIVGLIVSIVLFLFLPIDAILIVLMWGFFLCLGIGMVGMFIIEPMRDEKREAERLKRQQNR